MYELHLTRYPPQLIRRFTVEGMWLKFTNNKGKVSFIGLTAVLSITQNGKEVKFI